MSARKQMVLQAANQAMKLRQSMGVGLGDPLCVFDLAERMGIDVRFVDYPSMEGMYCKTSIPTILVSALRPSGRQRYSCAHEIGHHIFEHGTRVDEYLEPSLQVKRFEPEEFLAECFACFLLMPKSAVSRAFTKREWCPANCTAVQAYTVANEFGAGYSTLLRHMSRTLNLMPLASAATLLKVQPKEVRSSIMGTTTPGELFIVDQRWERRPIDLQVGDHLLASTGVSCESGCIERVREDCSGSLFRGKTPGKGCLLHHHSGWSACVRVCRSAYIGRSLYRHLEENEDD